MRSYEQMVEDGNWPPTNKEAAMFVVGALVGGFIGYALALVLHGLA